MNPIQLPLIRGVLHAGDHSKVRRDELVEGGEPPEYRVIFLPVVLLRLAALRRDRNEGDLFRVDYHGGRILGGPERTVHLVLGALCRLGPGERVLRLGKAVEDTEDRMGKLPIRQDILVLAVPVTIGRLGDSPQQRGRFGLGALSQGRRRRQWGFLLGTRICSASGYSAQP